MTDSESQFIQRTYQKPYRPTTTAPVPEKQRAAHYDPAESYNDFVWALARKFTNSPEEAEAAVKEMFGDIQRCAEKGVRVTSNEDHLVARIAWRRLVKFLQ